MRESGDFQPQPSAKTDFVPHRTVIFGAHHHVGTFHDLINLVSVTCSRFYSFSGVAFSRAKSDFGQTRRLFGIAEQARVERVKLHHENLLTRSLGRFPKSLVHHSSGDGDTADTNRMLKATVSLSLP